MKLFNVCANELNSTLYSPYAVNGQDFYEIDKDRYYQPIAQYKMLRICYLIKSPSCFLVHPAIVNISAHILFEDCCKFEVLVLASCSL